MSKKKGFERLAAEFEALPRALSAIDSSHDEHTVILARMVHGLSRENWQEASQAYCLDQWVALPVMDSVENGEEVSLARVCEDGFFAVSPFREARGALTREMFSNLLRRELLRISRNGGCLSLISASLAEKKRILASLGERTTARLDALLGSVLMDRLEACDSLGILKPGQFVCSLPGLGQLATRSLAETARTEFEDAARPFFPSGGINAGQGAVCAIGIVNVSSGDNCGVRDLLKRAKTTLDVALNKNDGYIHQESSLTPFDGTTLVQSSEKRFLFFGGDQQ